MSRPEDIILTNIQAEFGVATRLWRNVVSGVYIGKLVKGKIGGTITLAHSRFMNVGLKEGSADLIGIGPGGLFLSIEVKQPGQRPRPDQRKWRDMVLDRGGLAGTAHNVEEAGLIISGNRRE